MGMIAALKYVNYRLHGIRRIARAELNDTRLDSAYWYRARRGEEVPGTLPYDWDACPHNRTAVILHLINKLNVRKYLEVGCHKNENFACIPLIDKVGVDPAAGGTHRMTSDQFFASNADKFDLVFLDGLHTYGQVRNDILNALNCLNQGGAIVLHDMLPMSWRTQRVPRISGIWNGDVWKAAFEFSMTEGIDLKVVTVDHGVGVLTRTGVKKTPPDFTFDPVTADYAFFLQHYRKLQLLSYMEFCQIEFPAT